MSAGPEAVFLPYPFLRAVMKFTLKSGEAAMPRVPGPAA